MVADNKDEFVKLFQEFTSSYPYTPDGLSYKAAYDDQRRQGCRNFEAIAAAAESGEDVTESVLLQLLAYTDSATNRQKGAWIHHAATLDTDVRLEFEARKWINPAEWQFVAQAILDFVHCCKEDPRQLSVACSKFLELPYSRGFQAEMITPILNALRPDNFLVINKNSRIVINYFAHTSYSQKLTDYPSANATGNYLIKELAKEMHQPGVPALRDDDLFDMFSHWLVKVKNYDFVSEGNFPANKVIKLTSGAEEMGLQPEYTLTQCAEDTGFDEKELNRWVRGIERKKQAILYGSPGTGKTFIAEKLAQHLIGGGNGFKALVQFHPAYAYEDFIQGIRPQTKADGGLDYPLLPGRFLEFCKKAESCQDTCVLIIDEINRANLAQVFGELMYLLEYRDRSIPLAGGNILRIPANVRIIGTMNTADRSIALVDHALRRRFAFIQLHPNYEVLRRYHQKTGFPTKGLIETLKQLNNAIADPHYEIGISFFLLDDLAIHIEDIWLMEIEPYLEEYFFDQLNKVDKFRWHHINSQIYP